MSIHKSLDVLWAGVIHPGLKKQEWKGASTVMPGMCRCSQKTIRKAQTHASVNVRFIANQLRVMRHTVCKHFDNGSQRPTEEGSEKHWPINS